MKRICPRCNNELSTNCYVKDKGINTLSYLELIIKKDQFNKEHKEIKSCYCPKCGYVELYVDVDHQNQHLKKDDDLNSLRQTVRQYAIDYHQRIELERKKNEGKEILDKNDGRIDIKSELGKGTEVVIRIPTKQGLEKYNKEESEKETKEN